MMRTESTIDGGRGDRCTGACRLWELRFRGSGSEYDT